MIPISILHFSTADNEGGSAASAYRIHSGLRKHGYTSRMLVGKKVTNDSDVELIAGTKFGRLLDLFIDRYNRLRGHQYLYIPSSSRVLNHPWVTSSQIIQLYNIHGGYFSHTLLPALSKKAPIVWRLSDMWAMTAHSAYTYGCECYKNGVDHCVCALSSYPPIYKDTKKMLWEIKARIYSQSKFTIVAPSKWLEKAAKESLLLSRFPIHYIPNGIDLSIFYPRQRLEARKELGIAPNAKVILFTAHGLDHNPRKGSDLLIKALQQLISSDRSEFGKIENTMLLLVGEGGESFDNAVPMPIKKFGFIRDPNMMAKIYSAADLSVIPSVVENLPNNLLESMACGTPAVAFDTGGMSDAVRHMETGYLSRHADVDDFVRGMRMFLEDNALRKRLAESSSALIKNEFSVDREIALYSNLYSQYPRGRAAARLNN